MDIGVYSIKSVSNEKIRSFIEDKKSFILEDIAVLNMSEAIETLEKEIESKGLSCRVYLKGRAATMAAAAIPISPTVLGGWAAGIEAQGTDLTTVTNDGSKVTEFYLLADDGLRIVGEVENIGPGLKRDLVVKAAPGKYFTACKPGMIGDGIRAPFTVTDSGADLAATGADKELVDTANKQYASYVKDQTEQLSTKTAQFVAAYRAGDEDVCVEGFGEAFGGELFEP